MKMVEKTGGGDNNNGTPKKAQALVFFDVLSSRVGHEQPVDDRKQSHILGVTGGSRKYNKSAALLFVRDRLGTAEKVPVPSEARRTSRKWRIQSESMLARGVCRDVQEPVGPEG